MLVDKINSVYWGSNKTPNKDDVVILAIDEYERLKTKYEEFKILTKGE